MKKVIFVGWVNQGRVPVDGETSKNQYIIAELKKYCKVTILDFYEKNRHPWIYLQALWTFITQPKATIILSTSAKNVYGMLKLFKALHVKRDIIHWVVGGSFGKLVQEGRYRAEVFNSVKYNLVQCHGMIDELQSAGVTNSCFVSNFKPISYCPDLEESLAVRAKCETIRFVFLSRIRPEKGCEYILEAIRRLNTKNYQHRFSVDFYGKIDADYREQFLKEVGQLENVSWHGLLDLRTNVGYDTLASYHAMLFPTYWVGEGIAGIFIDAFIAALPVLTSDWAHNTEAITDGKQGIIYPVHDIEALTDTMEKCILGYVDLHAMAINARAEVKKHNAGNVITKEFLRNMNIL